MSTLQAFALGFVCGIGATVLAGLALAAVWLNHKPHPDELSR